MTPSVWAEPHLAVQTPAQDLSAPAPPGRSEAGSDLGGVAPLHGTCPPGPALPTTPRALPGLWNWPGQVCCWGCQGVTAHGQASTSGRQEQSARPHSLPRPGLAPCPLVSALPPRGPDLTDHMAQARGSHPQPSVHTMEGHSHPTGPCLPPTPLPCPPRLISFSILASRKTNEALGAQVLPPSHRRHQISGFLLQS